MSDFASQVLEAAAARPRQASARPKTFADEVLAAAADRAPFSDVAQQASGEFLRNVASVPATLGRLQGRVNRAVGGVVSPAVGEALAAQPEQIASAAEKAGNVIPPVPGQEDKFYSHVAGMAGQAVALAPAAIAGPGAVAAVGAGLGAEQGIEASQAAGGSTSDTVLSALGNAALQALTVYGPAGTLSRLGIKDATARSLIGEMLQGATVGTVQTLGSEGIAKATYDPQRVIDLGKAIETGMAMATVSGGTGALVEIAALRNRAKVGMEEPNPTMAPEGGESQSIHGAATERPQPSILPEPVQTPDAEQPLASEPAPVQAPDSTGTAPGATPPTPLPGRSVTPSPEAVPLASELSSGGETAPPAAVPPEAAGGAPRIEDVVPALAQAREDKIGPERLTALKHEATEADRATLGVDPYTGRVPKKDTELHARALETLKSDPRAGMRLIDELAESGRIPSDEEGMLLALDLNRLKIETDLAELGPAKDAAAKAFKRAADVTDALGSEAGAAFRARRFQIANDYSYAGMARRLRGGEEITAEDKAFLEDVHKSIATIEEKQRAIEARQAEIAFEQEIRQATKPARKVARAKRVAEIDREIEFTVREIGKSLVARAGLDPATVAKTAKVAALFVEKGILRFQDFAEAMVARLGEGIRPHLAEAWEQAKRDAVPADLAKAVIESGVRDRPKVIDAVTEFTGLPREEVVRAVQAPQLKAYKTRKARETAELGRKEAAQEFEKRTPEELRLDEEALGLRVEHEKAKRRFETKAAEYERARRSTARKVLDATLTGLNLPKALWSSFDVSAVFRQGAFFSGQDLFFRPAQLTRRLGRMFKALASEDYATKIDLQIQEHPLYPAAKRAGLELTGTDTKLTAREELFQSKLADKIPGIKQSDRAYRTYLNMLRFEHFRRILAGTDGSPAAALATANLVNVATGRGYVGKGAFAKAMPAAGAVLWAPRLYVSRFQLLLGQPLMRAGARRAILREYATSLASLAAVYGLVSLYNQTVPEDERATVSMDPTSPDGGKIKLGDTRVDPLAGLQQVTRLLTREGAIVAGESKENAAEVATTFLRTKVSPSISLPYALATGRDLAFGRKVDRADVARDALIPLSFRDIRDAMQAQGVPQTVALGILSLFGVGVNTYSDKKPARGVTAR